MGILERIFKTPGQRIAPDTDPSLETGKIDRCHSHLAELINRIQRGINSNLPPQVIEDMFIELRDYAHFHFRLEGMTFKENNQKKFNSYQDVHKKFIQTINELHLNFNSMKSPIPPASFESLRSQLATHISTHHIPFTEFLI